MSENLRKQIESQAKFSGNNHPFIKKVMKVIQNEYNNQNEAEEFANRLGLSRTMFMGWGGFEKIK